MTEQNKKSGNIPPCLTGEVNFCRGCPGWEYMINAQREENSLWSKFPVYCTVTGLTIYPENIKNKEEV